LSKREFNKKLLDLLACPKTGQDLTFDSKKNLLVTKDRRFSYKIIDGIPCMNVE